MIFSPTTLEGAYIVDLIPFSDERGWFARTFCQEEFRKIGHRKAWVQINHSFNPHKGTLRGMHFQYPPHSEAKLVRCISGAVFDVIIDLRHGSPTFLRWTGVELSAENRRMLYIPEGFAHGFQTLTYRTELIYHHSAFYHPEAEGGISHNDPSVGIVWPLPVEHISEKDKSRPYIGLDFKGIMDSKYIKK